MGQESIVKSTIIAEVKAHGSTEDSTLFHVMNKIMSKFDELEEMMFGSPNVTLPHAMLLVNLNIRGRFTMVLIKMTYLFLIINPNWPLRHMKLIGPIQERLPLNFLLKGDIILINMVG
jgi:hypothetical protein